MRINQNLSALNAYRNLVNTDNALNKNLERLSSGLRINRAADDAAGLAISEKMRGQVRGLNQAMRNAQDGISMIQTAEGALTETHNILQRMRELVVQAKNDTNTAADRGEIQQEISELIAEIDGIANRTEFNTKNLLNGTLGVQVDTGAGDYDELNGAGLRFDVSGAKAGGTYTFGLSGDVLTLNDGLVSQTINLDDAAAVSAGTSLNFNALGVKVTFESDVNLSATGITIDAKTFETTAGEAAKIQIGPNASQELSISFSDMKADALGSTVKLNTIDVTDTSTFDDQLAGIDEAIAAVSSERSKLGAYQNRLEHTIANLGVAAENLNAAESRVRDVDMASEMMEFTKHQILMQAGTAMLAQANMKPQSVLQLLA